MSALSLAANIIAILDLTGVCLKACSKQIGPSSYTSKQLSELENILYGLNGTTRNLQTCLEVSEEDEARLQSFQHLQEPLQRCDEALRLLNQRLQNQSVFAQYVTGAKFDQRFEDCMRVLGQAKELLDLALQCDQRTLISAAETYIRSVAKETQVIKSAISQYDELLTNLVSETNHLTEWTSRIENRWMEQEDREHKLKVLKWLSDTDPRNNFLDVLETKEYGTGQWFIDHERFKALESGRISRLWLNGISGAGKTYLMYPNHSESVTRTNAIDHFEKTNSASIAFFYFDFRDSAKQSTLEMLLSIASQLERNIRAEAVSEPVAKLYRECRCQENTRRPTMEEVMNLVVYLSNMHQSYIIIDALDECKNRTLLLSIIADLSKRTNDTKILVASRPELEFTHALGDASFAFLPVPDDELRADVELYINWAVQKDVRLKKLPVALKFETRDSLVANAGSKFRWVKCQLDVLRPLKSAKAFRNALTRLPRTLEETYDRILQGIIEGASEEALSMVKRLLAFVTFSKIPMTLPELAQALVMDLNAPAFDADASFLDPEEILLLCPSMLSVSPTTGLVGFVHYSVQEYLLSSTGLLTADKNPSPSPITTLGLDPLTAHTLLARLCLTFVLYDDFAVPFTSRGLSGAWARKNTYPFWIYASTCWTHHVADPRVQAKTLDLLARLLSPDEVRIRLDSLCEVEWTTLAAQPHRDEIVRPVREAYYLSPVTQSPPGKAGTGRLSRKISIDALHLSAYLALDAVIPELVAHGADVNRESKSGKGYPLDTALERGNLSTVKVLRQCGATLSKYSNVDDDCSDEMMVAISQLEFGSDESEELPRYENLACLPSNLNTKIEG